MKKYFPIKTESACKLKWAWSSVFLSAGKTASCCKAGISELTEENFLNFHNHQIKIDDRKAMLSGLWPGNGCEYCQNVEAAGGISERQFQATVPDAYPIELDSDPTLTTVDPVILEVSFENTCNLKCVYCSEKFSSSIEAENKRFGKITLLNQADVFENKYDKFVNLFWEWLEQNHSKLQRINIIGGEPLIQNDFERLLDFIEANPNPNLDLSIVTNLIIKPKRLTDCANKLTGLLQAKKIKRVDILCSVDGWGHPQEYTRFGFDSEIFEENLRCLLKHPFKMGLLSTINSLTIKELPDLAAKKLEWSRINSLSWYIGSVFPTETHITRPTIFDYSLWEDSFEKALSLIPNNNFDDISTRNALSGIMQKCKTGISDLQEQKKLIEYLSELDRRRNTNWQTTFPWLTKYVV